MTLNIRNPKEMNFCKSEEIDIFYLSKNFAYDISKIFEINGKKIITDDLVILEENYRNDDKKDLDLIEKHLFDFSYKGSFEIEPKNISLYAANKIKEEIENDIQIIIDLVRNKNYKYSDIKIVVSSIEDYKNQIMNSFTKNQIPFFVM